MHLLANLQVFLWEDCFLVRKRLTVKKDVVSEQVYNFVRAQIWFVKFLEDNFLENLGVCFFLEVFCPKAVKKQVKTSIEVHQLIRSVQVGVGLEHFVFGAWKHVNDQLITNCTQMKQLIRVGALTCQHQRDSFDSLCCVLSSKVVVGVSQKMAHWLQFPCQFETVQTHSYHRLFSWFYTLFKHWLTDLIFPEILCIKLAVKPVFIFNALYVWKLRIYAWN